MIIVTELDPKYLPGVVEVGDLSKEESLLYLEAKLPNHSFLVPKIFSLTGGRLSLLDHMSAEVLNGTVDLDGTQYNPQHLLEALKERQFAVLSTVFQAQERVYPELSKLVASVFSSNQSLYFRDIANMLPLELLDSGIFTLQKNRVRFHSKIVARYVEEIYVPSQNKRNKTR